MNSEFNTADTESGSNIGRYKAVDKQSVRGVGKRRRERKKKNSDSAASVSLLYETVPKNQVGPLCRYEYHMV